MVLEEDLLQLTPDDTELRIRQIEEELERLRSEKARLLQELLELDQL